MMNKKQKKVLFRIVAAAVLMAVLMIAGVTGYWQLLYLVPYFVLNCACRYAGFFLGKRFSKLPGWLIKACSLNKRYWM